MADVQSLSPILGARIEGVDLSGSGCLWDNAQLLHAAPLTAPTEARTLWRITVKENP